MYNQTSDRKLRKEKGFLTSQKLKLEATKEIKEYFDWQSSPNTEKAAAAKKWREYYEKVRTTEAYKDYFKMRTHWKVNDMKKVQELAGKARKRLEKGKFLPEPKETDPFEFTHGVYEKYRKICWRIENISNQLKEEEDVEDIFNQSKIKKNYKPIYA